MFPSIQRVRICFYLFFVCLFVHIIAYEYFWLWTSQEKNKQTSNLKDIALALRNCFHYFHILLIN